MKKLGFKNFRRFTDFPSLELGKINFLVGGNNAGKSTFVKAALLVNHFIHTRVSDLQKSSIFGTLSPEMIFDVVSPYDVHIGTFFRAKNSSSDLTAPIVFDFSLKDFNIQVKVSGTLVDGAIDRNAVSGKVDYIKIEDSERGITYSVDYTTARMYISFKKSNLEEQNRIEAAVIRRREIEEQLKTEKDFAKIAKMNSELAELNKLMHSTGGFITSDETLDLPLSDFSASSTSDYFLKSVIRSFIEYGGVATPSNLKKNSKEYKKDVAEKNLIMSKSQIITESMDNLSFAISQADVEYIYAHAARQIVFFNSKDKNDYMAQTLHEFVTSKASNNDKSVDFINYWMGENGFKIGTSYTIEEHGGEAYEVLINNGNSSSYLADMGMGSIQMMILLFRLATFIKMYGGRTYPPTIIIEEPEQNLHPALQGRLAELFKNLADTYKFSFIVETHSEYVVRNTQVLVASEKWADDTLLENNPFKVYYFPSSPERHPYAMEYRADGNFSNEFEPGFFDAANELLFAIL